jgi:hypothetical protein
MTILIYNSDDKDDGVPNTSPTSSIIWIGMMGDEERR